MQSLVLSSTLKEKETSKQVLGNTGQRSLRERSKPELLDVPVHVEVCRLKKELKDPI